MSEGKRFSLKISLGIIILMISAFTVLSWGDKSEEADHSPAFNQQLKRISDAGPPSETDRDGGRGGSGY